MRKLISKIRERGSRALSLGVAGALVVVPVALITLFVISLVSGGDEEEPRTLARVQSADHSWLIGQSSLIAYPDFLAIANPAIELGDARFASYQDLLAFIEAQRLKDLKEEQILEAIRLLEQCEAAREEYKRALARAEAEREREEERIREKQEKIQRQIERLRERHKVNPGEECGIGDVAEFFTCSPSYPFPKPKPPEEIEPPPAPPPPPPCELPPILQGIDLDKYRS